MAPLCGDLGPQGSLLPHEELAGTISRTSQAVLQVPKDRINNRNRLSAPVHFLSQLRGGLGFQPLWASPVLPPEPWPGKLGEEAQSDLHGEQAIPEILRQRVRLPCQSEPVRSHEALGEDVSEASARVPLTLPRPPSSSPADSETPSSSPAVS